MAVAGEKDAADVRALASSIEQLRKRYDQYFAGLEKLEPLGDRKRVQKELDRLAHAPITNTQVRFQLAQAKGRFITLQGQWNRITLEIERGTYRRDRLRLERKESLREVSAESSAAHGGKRRLPDEPLSGELVEKLHRAYVYAKQRCNEPTDGISKERLQASLAKQVERMRSEHPEAKPEFKVVIKDGKARIVARRSD